MTSIQWSISNRFHRGRISFFGFSFLISILLLISAQEGDGIKIKIRSKIKGGTPKSGMRPSIAETSRKLEKRQKK
jgi:hypothetical protein